MTELWFTLQKMAPREREEAVSIFVEIENVSIDIYL